MRLRGEKVLNDLRYSAFFLLLLFVGAYWVPLKGVVTTWLNDGDYSYGFLIPIVSAYLVWERRSWLKNCRAKSSWLVLPVLVTTVMTSLYGILGSSGNVSRPLIPVLLILFAAFCFGLETAKILLLPLGFLVFMIPAPAFLERTIGMALKSVASKWGGELIRLCGIPVHVSGNVIDLGVSELQVVDACSGMRYLIPLLALGVMYAYFFECATWKRLFCVCATIPIAVLTNVLRIGITGVLTNSYGSGAAEGFMHDLSGWVLFMVSFVFLCLLGRVLSFLPPRRSPGSNPSISQKIVTGRPAPDGSDIRPAFFTAAVLLAIVGAMSISTKALPAVRLKGGIASFPLGFSDWQGRPEFMEPETVAQSGAEEAFSCQYRSGGNEPVSLYIGYRSSAFLENENFFHSPTICLPSSGWKTILTGTHKITGVQMFGSLTVTEMVVEDLNSRLLVYFWFQTKDKATHDKNINRLNLSLHALMRDNTHDIFLRTITPVPFHERIEDAEKRMDRFVTEMTGELIRFLKERQNAGNDLQTRMVK